MTQSSLQTVAPAPVAAAGLRAGAAAGGQYLVFTLGGEVFAIDILQIREIIEFGELTEVPMTPPTVRGVINLRGAVVPVIDLAGGIVVHATAGVSALVIAAMLGKRNGFPNHVMPPHSPWMVVVGTGLLWVGWFGFNAGSQVAANGSAGMTMLVTHLAAASGTLTWALVERLKTGKTGIVGAATGTIAGLATVTPASGVVGPAGAIALGIAAGIVCYFACSLVKGRLGVDDSLDVFAVHGLGGIMGSILLAVLGTSAFGGFGSFDMGPQLLVQLKCVGVVVVWSAVATVAIVKIAALCGGLRVSPEEEETGLDDSCHGEKAYHV